MAKHIHIHVGKTKDSSVQNKIEKHVGPNSARRIAEQLGANPTYEQVLKAALTEVGPNLAKAIAGEFGKTKDASSMDVQQAQSAINNVKRLASSLRGKVEDDLHVAEPLEE